MIRLSHGGRLFKTSLLIFFRSAWVTTLRRVNSIVVDGISRIFMVDSVCFDEKAFSFWQPHCS